MAIEAELARDETVDGAGSKMQREEDYLTYEAEQKERLDREIERIQAERL